jgi:hypothetical protein
MDEITKHQLRSTGKSYGFFICPKPDVHKV